MLFDAICSTIYAPPHISRTGFPDNSNRFGTICSTIYRWTRILRETQFPPIQTSLFDNYSVDALFTRNAVFPPIQTGLLRQLIRGRVLYAKRRFPASSNRFTRELELIVQNVTSVFRQTKFASDRNKTEMTSGH